MPRGGHREKSGRKSTWKSGCSFGETKLIRVPRAIADQLLEIAHNLDAGESLDLVTEKEVERLKLIVSQWRVSVDKYSVSNTRWSKARLLLDDFEVALGLKPAEKMVLIDIDQPISTPSRLRITALATYLGVPEATVRHRRDSCTPEAFIQWSRSKDPQGVGWRYDLNDRYCYPVLN